MRLFVTGGTGFIGSHFINAALAAGHEVVGLRRSGSTPAIDLGLGPEWVEAELDGVPDAALQGSDALVHFAAHGVSPQPSDWRTAFAVNVQKSLELCVQAQRLGVPHLLCCGSCFEYGQAGARYEQIPASAPLEPSGPYASSKAAFSVALAGLARSSELTVTLLRPFHLFGAGQHEGNFWPALKKAALAGEDFAMTAGEQVRDYLPVEDAAGKFLEALSEAESARAHGGLRVANIGSGVPVTLADFARHWWDRWAAAGELRLGAIPYRENEVMRFVPDIES